MVNYKQLAFFAALLIFILAKLYVVSAQTLSVFGSDIDDRLFVDLAKSIAEGNWLGEYNNRTLIKGPFYPLWIALNYKLGIPLLLSEHLLYIFACLIFIYSINTVIKSRSCLLIIFVIILFNPMTYTNGVMTMVLRSGIYPSLAILVVSVSINLLLKNENSLKSKFGWSICLGLFLSAFWLSREESIWITPFVVIITVFGFAKIIKLSYSTSVNKYELLVWIMPFFTLFLSIGTIVILNKCYYNKAISIEVKSSAFESAYGALLRVKQKHWKPAVPVSREVREEIYSVSSAFSELRPFLEGQIGKRVPDIYSLKQTYEKGMLEPTLTKNISNLLKNDKSGIWRNIWNKAHADDGWEIYGISFIWALRDAVAAAGYYNKCHAAERFYLRLSDEINRACEDGRLDCLSSRSTLRPPWRSEYLMPLIKTILYSFLYVARFSEFNPESGYSSADPKLIDLFSKITHEDTSPPYSQFTSETNNSVNTKTIVLRKIGHVYQIVTPYIVMIMVALHLFTTIECFVKIYLSEYWVIATSIAISIMVLLLGLSYIHVSSFPAVEVMYFAPIYPLMLIYFIFVSLGLVRPSSVKGKTRN